MSNRLTKSPFPLPSLDRDEFLTPFGKVFDDFFAATSAGFSKEFGEDFFQRGAYPKVDVIAYENTIELEVEVPGLSKEDVNVELKQNVLTVYGSKHETPPSSGDKKYYLIRELRKSSFRRSFSIGDNIDQNTIDAKFENGILFITLHKVKPSNIDVRKVVIK